ncbi:hypothetical protein IJI31_05185 [bacterium]|nr:hypothetical protein [bacterium]
MKNKIIIIVLCFICFGLTCKAELIKSVSELQPQSTASEQVSQNPPKSETSVSGQDGQTPQDTETTEATEEQPVVEEQNPDEVQPSGELVEQAIKHKVPMGIGNILKKFLFAMLCVAGSCVFLYLILLLFKKGRGTKTIADRLITDYENTLDTPQNLDDAINIFLDKNKL